MDWVVKIGGSLFPEDAVKLCQILTGQSVLVICGGGELANLLRKYDRRMVYSSTTTHKSAILCMDILGMLLADKIASAEAIYSPDHAGNVLYETKLPVLIPSQFLFHQDPLEHSWRVTSDSLSLYIAHQLKAKLLIATDVDGIYDQRSSSDDAQLIRDISAKKLLNFGETSVDEFLAKLLLQYKMSCHVINGKYPERVLSIIEGKSDEDTKYTLIGGN